MRHGGMQAATMLIAGRQSAASVLVAIFALSITPSKVAPRAAAPILPPPHLVTLLFPG